MKLDVRGFLGANLALDPTLLSDMVGVDSVNQWPGKDDLRPWKQPLQVATVPSAPQRRTIWRMGQDVSSDTNYWLSWTSVVHAVRDFDPDDTTERTLFTGSGSPKWTNNSIALASPPYPTATRELAVPAPISAPLVSENTPGTGDDETWYYVHTFVNDIGWESAPSPPSAPIVAKPGAIIDITSLESAPSGNYGITLRRIYKGKTGASGNTEFFFLREIAVGNTSTQDDARALGEVLPTGGQGAGSSWLPLPATAKGLTEMWNGMLAAIVERSVRICEPYHGYAWPLKYEIQTMHPPVALAVWNQSLGILTTGDVLVANGSSPEAFDDEPTKILEPCASATGVVMYREGFVWPSPSGYQWFGEGGHRNLTLNLLDRQAWKALNPASIVASRHLGLLVASYDDGVVKKGFVLDPRNPTGLYWLSSGYDAMFRDPLTDELYVLEGGNIKKWNAGAALMTASFRSKQFELPADHSFAWCRVVAAAYPVTVKVWRDGTLVFDRAIIGKRAVRLPQGRGRRWQIEASGNAGAVQLVRLATSAEELRQP